MPCFFLPEEAFAMSHMEANSVYSTPRGSRFLHVRDTGHWMSPGRVIGLLVGAAVTFVGMVSLFKTGVSSELNTPLTTVFGMTQSPAVGLIELAAGVLLILSAASESTRPLMGFIGALMMIAGIVATVANFEIQRDVGFDPDAGWFFAVAGFIALVAAMLPAVWRERHEYDEDTRPLT